MPSFFDRYISLVEDIGVIEALETYSPESLFSDTDALESLGDKVYAPGKWTIRDILQHCIDTERIMSYRALRFARHDATPLPGFDENEYAQRTLAASRTVHDLLDEFELVRAGTLAQFAHFSAEMLTRVGTASAIQMSVGALGFVIVGHAMHHLQVVQQRYVPLLGT